jgi:hypothetical protein
MSTFLNNATALYLEQGEHSSTPTYVFIPTVTLEESPQQERQTWYSTEDVQDDLAYEDGVVTAVKINYKVETKQFKTTGTTPELIAGLKEIRACKGKGGDVVKKWFVVVEPDGSKNYALFDVMNVVTLKGGTQDVGGLAFELYQCKAPVAFAGTLPA